MFGIESLYPAMYQSKTRLVQCRMPIFAEQTFPAPIDPKKHEHSSSKDDAYGVIASISRIARTHQCCV